MAIVTVHFFNRFGMQCSSDCFWSYQRGADCGPYGRDFDTIICLVAIKKAQSP